MSRRSTGRPRLAFAIVVAIAIPAVLIVSTLVRTITKPRVPSTHLVPLAGRPSAVAVARGLVWVADDQRQDVHAIDPRTGSAVASIAVGRGNIPIALAASERWLWVGTADGVVLRIDLEKRRVGAQLAIGQSITGIAARGNRVWACDLPGNVLVEIDAATAKIVRTIDIARGPVRVIATEDALWVANRENTVTRVDPRTGHKSKPITVGPGPIGLAFTARHLWVASSDDGTVVRIEGNRSLKAGRPIDVGHGPVGLAATPTHVWVVLQDDRSIVEVNALTARVVGDPIPLGTRPRGIVASTNDVYVVGTDPGALVLVR